LFSGEYYRYGAVRTPPSAEPDDGAFIMFMVGVVLWFWGDWFYMKKWRVIARVRPIDPPMIPR